MLKTQEGRNLLHREYVENGKSTYQIAQELGTYANEVRRALVFHGFPLRDRSGSQSASLAIGRSVPPLKGKKHKMESREKMSENIAKAYEDMSEEARQGKSLKLKEKWCQRSSEDKEKMQTLAAQGRKRAAEDGSKLEQYLLLGLQSAGYSTQFHVELGFLKDNMHIDILLPKEHIAIEIDGPTHFEPIWGTHELKKMAYRDTEKNGRMVTHHYNVIRVRQHRKNVSQAYFRKMLKELLATIDKIKKSQKHDVYFIEGY
jgi:very-short-patch-repair endonuclease